MEDHRLRGISLMLNGAGVTLITSILASTVVQRSTSGSMGIAYAPDASLAFPNDTIFLVTTVAAVVAVALFIGAYDVSTRVRYTTNRPSTSTQQEIPPV